MIFQRALRREMASAAGATFTVLFSILRHLDPDRYSRQGGGRQGRVGDVIALIVFSALNYLPTSSSSPALFRC
jgi:lipopolysaccharide export system permease protein